MQLNSIPTPVATVEAGAKHLRTAYEHPWAVRLCHWLNTVSLFVMAASGLRIFRAFPSFGPKIPQHDLLNVPASLTLGGWLGGGLQWHLTFAWIYVATGIFYFGYQILSGNFRQSLFVPHDLPGVWPMIRHYFFFGRKPPQTEAYNPLQKMAYTSAILLGLLSFLTGIVLFNPVQFSFLGFADGRFPLGASVAFWRAVRVAPLRPGPPGHGDLARVEQFHVHADGLEARPGILALTIVRSCQKRCKIENGTKRKL